MTTAEKNSLYVSKFSLTDDARDAIAEIAEQMIGKRLKEYSREDVELLGRTVLKHMPEAIIEDMRSTTEGNNLNPIVIRNLTPPDQDLPPPGSTHNQYIATPIAVGIHAVLGHDKVNGIAVERTVEKGKKPRRFHAQDEHGETFSVRAPGYRPHFDDLGDYSVLIAIRNKEQTNTIVMDLDAAVEALDPELRKAITLAETQVTPEINLDTYANSGRMRSRGDRIGQFIVDHHKTDSEALRALNVLAKHNSAAHVLEANEMLFWNNAELYHCIGKDVQTILDPNEMRLLVNVSGNSSGHSR